MAICVGGESEEYITEKKEALLLVVKEEDEV